MGAYVADTAVKKMVQAGLAPAKTAGGGVLVLGLTFKENCPDIRNSKVCDIIARLKEYGINPYVVDPWASEHDAMREYGIKLSKIDDISEMDCIIVAVAHDEFKKMGVEGITRLLKKGSQPKVLIDVKGILNIKELNSAGISWWRL